jgi:iron-sulfur cluster repair protein YtfE (RIC family)
MEGDGGMTDQNHTNQNDIKQQPGDAVAMLTADHRQVRVLLQQYAETPDPYLQQIIAEHVFAELTLHLLLEETVFYPAFAEQTDEEGKRLVREALQDHQQLRDHIATLQAVAEDDAFEAAFQALRDHVDRHFADEETTLFPQAAQDLATHWEEIPVLLQERKAQILAS